MPRATVLLRDRWNHNTHYYSLAVELAAARPGGVALDAGCGDGLLLDLLAPHCRQVVGLDASSRIASTALTNAREPNVGVVVADLLRPPFEPESFDLIVSFAVVHHVDLAAGLGTFATLLRPGGTLLVVGLEKYTPATWLRGGLGIPAHRLLQRRYGLWKHTAPIAQPQLTGTQIRRIARAVLPGMRWRWHLLWRYSLTWTKPAAPG